VVVEGDLEIIITGTLVALLVEKVVVLVEVHMEMEALVVVEFMVRGVVVLEVTHTIIIVILQIIPFKALQPLAEVKLEIVVARVLTLVEIQVLQKVVVEVLVAVVLVEIGYLQMEEKVVRQMIMQ
jgi:hypothetical protein